MRLFRPFAALALATLVALPAAAGDPAPATISVTGEGRVEMAPDMATVSLGVQTEADTASAALAANSEAIAGALARLRAAGIEDRDLQTSGLTLNPRYAYDRSGSAPEIGGYVATNMVTVRIRDLAVLGPTLDAVVTDGANTLGGLSFGLKEPQATKDEARRRAVADAARRAALLAEAAGVKLGRVLSITDEGGFGGPQPMMMMAEAALGRSAESVPVASGELTVAASVAIVYEIAE